MVENYFIIEKEEGSAIVIVMLMLAVLTILGISSIDTSTVEMKIVRNERIYQRDFYIADSAWKDGAQWLEQKNKAPSKINTNGDFSVEELKMVRN